ncbi:MAG: hypothetical protein U0Y68_19120 [Blastocatellia bacterium]
MDIFTLGQELPSYTVTGYNYAFAHDNKIHSDDVAAQFGFKGGLVPGVGVYAYLTHPVVAALGTTWLERGAMIAKFLKPLYHDEKATVRATVTQLVPLTLSLHLHNAEGMLCAVGEASLPTRLSERDSTEFPSRSLPASEARPAATIANLPVAAVLGSLNWSLDLAALASKFLSDMRATLPCYFGAEALCHPAHYLAQANEILMANVKLGPWIHTSSAVQHYALSHDGERLSLRGAVVAAEEKRGHEIVTLELGLCAEDGRLIAHIRHTAIVRLRGV